MKALIFAHGTRGDVQPYVALAHALQQSGHETTLAAPSGSASLAEPYGIPFAPLDDSMNEGMNDPDVRSAMETNYRGLRGKLTAFKLMRRAGPELRKVLDDMAAVPATDVDIVVHPVNSPIQHLAEKLGVPAVAVGLQPGWVPTSEFSNPLLPFRIPKRLNHASYLATRLVLWALVRSGGRWRADTLGLPRRPHQNDAVRAPDGTPITLLNAFSEHVLLAPPKYPTWTHTTGYWFLPAAADWEPPEHLTTFLDAGSPPVYIGFGSMAGRDPARIGRIVSEAVHRADVRAVLVTGWGGIDAELDSERFLVLDQAPHDWLFPRTAAIVHHGGGGTTGAALAAGRPQVVCPFIADQPFWASRMAGIGVAPPPLLQCDLTADNLAAALRTATADQSMATTAADVGAKIRGENGVATAVEMLESLTTR